MLIRIHRVQQFLLIVASMLALLGGPNTAAAQSVPLLVQAESMTLVSPMSVGHDIAAMGGRFISAASGTSTTNPLRSASVEVNVPAGSYYLWARIAGATSTSDALYVGIDSSFDRVFPSAFGPYQWVRVETSDGSGAHAFSLTGSHTIQVGFGEIGAKLDAVYLTADANEVPAFSSPAKLLIEAEAMNRTAPMTVLSEPAALGGQFLSPTSGANSTTPTREASVTVDVPAGTFYLWARIAGPTSTSDALYAGINISWDRIFPSLAAGEPAGTYKWVRVETSDGSGIHGFALAAATHVIQVGHGEIGARLDAVYLTSDATEVPAFAPMRRVIEAESFTLQSPITVGTDANAGGAQYISPTSGTNSTSPVREAWTTVTAPVSGTYYLWARIGGASIASDALYVGFDSSFARVFPANPVPYEWVRVETAPGSGTFGFSLAAGPHDIQVGHGEIGARLDAVYVTDDANDAPSGAGAQPTAACALPTGQYQYQGFGRNTTGGLNQPVVRVTNLNDSGPGSLREALSAGNRCIVFDVAGEIDMTNRPSVDVPSNVTIDGLTAPSPGITFVNHKPTGPDEGAESPIIEISRINSVPVENVVVRGIRIRKSPGDAIRVDLDASRVVLDRVSVTGFGDGAVDVVRGSRDVTIQWSILGQGGNPNHNFLSLIGLGAARVSAHHNLYVSGNDRQPMCSTQPENVPAERKPVAEPVCDVRNNLVWNYMQKGTTVRHAATGNVINNYYKAGPGANPGQTIWLGEVGSQGIAYINGNHSQDGFSINNGNRSTPFPIDAADVPSFTDARTAAQAVKAGAGARGPSFGLDATDQAFINGITIP